LRDRINPDTTLASLAMSSGVVANSPPVTTLGVPALSTPAIPAMDVPQISAGVAVQPVTVLGIGTDQPTTAVYRPVADAANHINRSRRRLHRYR